MIWILYLVSPIRFHTLDIYIVNIWTLNIRKRTQPQTGHKLTLRLGCSDLWHKRSVQAARRGRARTRDQQPACPGRTQASSHRSQRGALCGWETTKCVKIQNGGTMAHNVGIMWMRNYNIRNNTKWGNAGAQRGALCGWETTIYVTIQNGGMRAPNVGRYVDEKLQYHTKCVNSIYRRYVWGVMWMRIYNTKLMKHRRQRGTLCGWETRLQDGDQ
jgi:hypothetical protein